MSRPSLALLFSVLVVCLFVTTGARYLERQMSIAKNSALASSAAAAPDAGKLAACKEMIAKSAASGQPEGQAEETFKKPSIEPNKCMGTKIKTSLSPEDWKMCQEKKMKDQKCWMCTGKISLVTVSKDASVTVKSQPAPAVEAGKCRTTFCDSAGKCSVARDVDGAQPLGSNPKPEVKPPPTSTPSPAGGGQPKGQGGQQPGGQQGGGGGGMPQIPMPPPPMPPPPPPPPSGGGSPPSPPPPPPSCIISASPMIIQPGGTSTLSWSSFNAQAAVLSGLGAVPTSGSQAITVASTTTYTLTVWGEKHGLQSNSFADSVVRTIAGLAGKSEGGKGHSATCSATLTVTAPTSPSPAPGTCTSNPRPAIEECSNGAWEPQYNSAGCLFGWRCTPFGTPGALPSGTISCRPSKADIGTDVTIGFRCENSTESVGNGFSTGGIISGTTTVTIQKSAFGDSSKTTFILTCKNGSTAQAKSCTVGINPATIVLTANPRIIARGASTIIGWITTGMSSCTIKSPDLPDFTEENEDTEEVNGVVRTPPLVKATAFTLDCTTLGGDPKSANVIVKVE